MLHPLDTSVDRRLKVWSGYFNIALVAIPAVVLLGWQFNIYFFKAFFLPPRYMYPTIAVCFILLGCAAFLEIKRARSQPGLVLILLVVLAGLLKISGYITGTALLPDDVLFRGKLDSDSGATVLNISPVTAICFVLSGLALLIRRRPGTHQKITHYFLLAIAFTSLLSLLGYLYQVPGFTGLLVHIYMPPSTALCFFLFTQVVLFSEPGLGIMKEFTSVFSGSMVARVLIPAAIIFPSVLALLQLQGRWAGLYADEFGTALFVLGIIMIFAWIIWYNAYLLNKRDALKKQTEDELRESQKNIQAILQNAPDAVVVIDSTGIVTRWNHEAALLFGWSADEARGRLLNELIVPPELRSSHAAGLQRLLDTGMATILGKTIDTSAIRKDGSLLDISLRISPLDLAGRKFFIGFIRDITERKIMEEKLLRFNDELSRQVDEKTGELKEIFERITDGFIALDREFRYTYMNKKAAELVQRDPATLMGKIVWDEFPQAVGSDTYRSFLKAMNEQQVVVNTDYYAPLDLWQSNFIYPSPNGISIFIRDISVQKKAETEIDKAKTVADKLIDSLPGVFYFFDSDGRFIRWNKTFEKVTGYTAEEIAMMKPIDFFPEEHKSYISNRIAAVFEKGINDAEASFITKDGKKIPYFFKAVMINYDNKPCLLGTGIDITERKRTEEELIASEGKYKLLFEGNPLPMWMLRLPDYTIVDVNNAALEQYGYQRDEFLRLSVYDFRPHEDYSKLRAATDTSFRGIHHSGIWRHIKKDKTLIYVDIITYDLIYRGQQTRLVLANNVTEKHVAEEKLKESYNAIRNLTGHLQEVREEERLHISREIHDELGQLLTVLKMDISWLTRKIDLSNEQVKSKLQEITSVIDITSKTIRRIASELRPSLLDDLGLLAAIEWHLEEFEKRSGISKELQIPDAEIQLPNTLKIGIFRIFQESMTNVARHSGATRVKVSLIPKNKQLILTVSDNGKGLADRQGNKKTLGLLGMKERSQMMGGHYQITSEPGEGTTVVVTVPLPETDL